MSQIKVFAAKSTVWTGNGQAVLDPVACEVSETAGGSYELEMIHPCDELGKWRYLVEEAIIKAPVPVQDVPAIESMDVENWRIKSTETAGADVYAKPLVYTYVPSQVPVSEPYDPYRVYNRGDYVTYGSLIFRYIGQSGVITEEPGTGVWEKVSQYNPSGGSGGTGYYTGGGVIGHLDAGTIFLKLADYDGSWMRIRMMNGTEGYVRTSVCEYYSEHTSAIEPRTVREQCFRIYKVTIDSTTMEVTVNARHISYDLYGMVIGACSVQKASPSSAIAAIQAAMLTEDIRTIATNISDTTVTQDWSWKNAAFALLDPDTGIVPNIKARLIRDNNDFFLLQNVELDNGYRIEYGGNMIGVNWDVDVEEVVTRIIPKCKDADGKDLFLPEQWIDADNAEDYAALRMSVMDCEYQEGKEYKDEEGQTEILTKERCYELMRADVEKAYEVDKVNQATFSLSVEFVNLGDTEEYKQYRGLQRLNLYDTVHIRHGKLGLVSDMQMKAYVWDCILQRYISAEFGDAFESVGGDIPGYELANDSIKPDKISGDTKRDLNTTYTLTKSGSTIKLTGSDGNNTQVTDSDTTYSNATQSAAGLMSAQDKIALDSAVADTNVTVSSIRDTSNTNSASGNVRKIGKLVVADFSVNMKAVTADTWTNIAAIPSGYRPGSEVFGVAATDTSSDSVVKCSVTAQGAMRIQIGSALSSGVAIRGTMCWMV